MDFCPDKCNHDRKPFVHFFAKFGGDNVGLFCWPQASNIGEVDNCVVVLRCDDTFFPGTCEDLFYFNRLTPCAVP